MDVIFKSDYDYQTLLFFSIEKSVINIRVIIGDDNSPGNPRNSIFIYQNLVRYRNGMVCLYWNQCDL